MEGKSDSLVIKQLNPGACRTYFIGSALTKEATVLSKDILTIQPHEILDIEVLFTVVGGEVVYATRANDSAAAN